MKTPLKVHLALLVVALIYGINYVVAKGVMPEYLGPSGFILLRITVAAILFNLLAMVAGTDKIRSKKDYVELAIAAFFGVAANMLLFFHGLSHTSELNASTLMLNAPIFVLIFSMIILKDRIRWWQVIGMVISALGAILLIGGDEFQFSGATAKGDVMVLLNATSFAFFLVFSKRILQKYSALTMIRYMFIFGLIYVLPFGLSDVINASYSSFPSHIWWSIVYVSVGTTFVAYLLNVWAVKHASPTIAGSYIYLQPLIATSVAIALGKQPLSAEKVIFAFLIFTGVYLVTSYSKQA